MAVNPWRPEEGQIATWGGFFKKILDNFDETVIKGFKIAMFPFLTVDNSAPSTFMEIAGAMLILALIAYGAWNFGRYRYMVLLYIIGNTAICLLWHGGNSARYVHPITPFLLFSFLWGIICLGNKISILKKYPQVLSYALLGLVFLHITPIKERRLIANAPYSPAYKNYFTLAKGLNPRKAAKINTETIVACRKPEMFSYYSNCLSTSFLNSLDSSKVIEDLVKANVDYVVLEQLGYASTGRYLYPAIVAYPDLFDITVQLKDPDTYLLKFKKDKALDRLKQPANAVLKNQPAR